ncbi:integrase [Methylobacterium sp. 1973]
MSASHRRHAHRGASVPHLSRKTEHARRVVPVHGSARPILQQRVARSSDGWVCSGLTPAGPDGKRSWIVVKRFATFCQKVLGPSKQVDVHSFRRCFATYLQRASKHTTTVNSSVIAELMGHAKPRSALPYTRQDSDRSNSEPPSRL